MAGCGDARRAGSEIAREEPRSAHDSPQVDITETGYAPSDTAFQYPFPERQNPFLRPLQAVPVSTATIQPSEPVELKGFLRVDELKALLVWEGQVEAMKVGEYRRELKVLAIEPPLARVELRGQTLQLKLKK